MRWLDVSLPLSSARPTWPGDEPFQYRETSTIAAGANSNGAAMSLSVHFATHMDAPYHFIPGGATIDRLPLDLLIGPCLVIAVPEAGATVEPEHLADRVPPGTLRLLVKTRNSAFIRDAVFHTDFTAFSREAALWLVDRGVRLLGIDYFSIARYKQSRPAHEAFLGAGGAAVEGLDLSSIDPGCYELCCLPMKIEGSGGAPARVVLGVPS